VLHTFTGEAGGGPHLAGLIGDSEGNLYSTTRFGGSGGVGVVFKLDASRTETVLQNFTEPNGSNPEAPLIRDSAGNLYGTTNEGLAEGVLFKLDPTHRGDGDHAQPRRCLRRRLV
jgi:uncharacterized repeat protein (TIGR03803 family)